MPFLIKTPGSRRLLAVATAVSLSCLFCFATQPQAYAAAPGILLSDNGGIEAKVAQLETHFFDHPFSSESISARLDRLETMVFGQKRTGTDQQRLNALILVMPPQSSVTQSGQEAAMDRPAEQPSVDHTAQQPYANHYAPAPSVNNGVATGLEPTVSNLEMQVFGTTHRGQSIASRLNSLEDTVFSADTDHNGSFGDRISRVSIAVGGGSDTAQASVPPPANYQRGYTSTAQMQQQPQIPRMNNGHPVLKKAAEAAIVVGAVAGVAALTIMAAKGMGGGKHGLFKKFDLD